VAKLLLAASNATCRDELTIVRENILALAVLSFVAGPLLELLYLAAFGNRSSLCWRSFAKDAKRSAGSFARRRDALTLKANHDSFFGDDFITKCKADLHPTQPHLTQHDTEESKEIHHKFTKGTTVLTIDWKP
jgi:hypothetical protein